MKRKTIYTLSALLLCVQLVFSSAGFAAESKEKPLFD